ncbi:luciferin 4-monooxygenase-like [Drosophila albomicans]|uniref:Luciferin 4-monooxygenase-like n=1 Tax=Drosophila albomicans TaxID=7291 RepID=A0A9C6W8W8_DROAB|nr:luciferin 4-monooxygenase-like [Drosophila albomicans]
MKFKPETTYNAEEKIWYGHPKRSYFGEDLSIGEIIFREMKRHPKLIAQISDSENTLLTREELRFNSMRVASFMRRLGMVQTDIVGIIARNTTHIFAVAYACFFNGIAFHSLNITYEESTIGKLFDITKPRLIFCDGDEYEKVKAATIHRNVLIVTMRKHHKDSISIDKVLATPIEEDFKPAILEQGIDQTLAILCSSGTTGIPKAVTITNSRMILYFRDHMTTNDVMYTHSTLDWLSGLAITVNSGVYSSSRIIDDNLFDPARILRLIEKYKITWLSQTPAQMAMISHCKEFDRANLQSICSLIYGGGQCSREAQVLIRNRLGGDYLHSTYGCTESGSVSLNRNFDEKPNSVGRLIDGFKLKILNERGEALGPNEVGEISVDNGEHWPGYYGNPEETEKLRDIKQWFHSGDLGYMDDDGFLYIVGRKKDMLKYQNIMYYPNEIENLISQMPDVIDVCVFGIWTPHNGDEAAAAVVRKADSQITAEDVVDYVQHQTTVKYKQLNGGAIIVDDLMRSPNGKTNRAATKAYFINMMQRETE